MKSIVSASVALLCAGIGLAPLATAHTMNPLSPQPAISQATTQTYTAPWYRQQQSMLSSGQINDPPAEAIGMGSGFDPYPPGYGLYSGGGG